MKHRTFYQFEQHGPWHFRRDSQGGFLVTLCGLKAVQAMLGVATEEELESRTDFPQFCETCRKAQAARERDADEEAAE